MDQDIVALERDLGHDPEAFHLAVEALRAEYMRNTDDHIPHGVWSKRDGSGESSADASVAGMHRHEQAASRTKPVGRAPPSRAVRAPSPVLRTSSFVNRTHQPQQQPKRPGSPATRTRSPVTARTTPGRGIATPSAPNPMPLSTLKSTAGGGGGGGSHFPHHASGPSRVQQLAATGAAYVDVEGHTIALTPSQEQALAAFRSGRSLLNITGPHSGRAFLATLLIRSALGADEASDPCGPCVAVIASAGAYAKLSDSVLLHRGITHGHVLVGLADTLMREPWAAEELASVSTVVIVGDSHGFDEGTLAHAFANLPHVPQIAMILDRYDPKLLQRDPRSERSEMLAWHDQGGAARMPLMRVQARELYRGLLSAAGGSANLAVRVKKEESKLPALKRMIRELFTYSAIIVVTLTQRKAERLAEALDGFVPGIRAQPASQRDPADFSDAMGTLARAVQARDLPPSPSHDATSGRWAWCQRAIAVADIASLRHIPLLRRACAVIFFDVPQPPTGGVGRVSKDRSSFEPSRSSVLEAKVTLFPDAALTAVLTTEGPEARREAGDAYVEVFPE